MNVPRKQTVLEFTLYALIILMTALPAFFYKIMSGIAPSVRLNIWVAVPYFGVLIWAFMRLNSVHRKRKAQQETAPRTIAVQTELPARPQEPTPVAGSGEQAQSIFGLTLAQVAILLLVFTTAIVSFTWALRALR